MNKPKVTALITVFLTFILFIVFQPGDDPLALVRIASIVAVAVVVLIVIYTHFLWKIEPFKRFHKVVDVSGKWQAKFVDKEQKESIIEIKVKQYYDDVNVEVFMDKKKGESLVTKIIEDPDSSKLYVVYKCKPLVKVETKEDIDYGTIMVRLDEDILEGEFFDSKNISGHIEFYRMD